MNEPQRSLRRVSLTAALNKGVRAVYDHLGYVVTVSFVSLIGAVGLVALGLKIIEATKPGMFLGAAALMPGVFFYYLCAAGVFYFANRVVCRERPSVADTWIGIRKLWWPAVRLFVINAVAMAVLLGDAAFFLSTGPHRFGMVIVVLCIYGAGLWAAAAVYHLPLLSAQLTMESGPRPIVVIRKSFLLALGSPGFTLGLFLAIIALAVLCAIPAGLGTAVLFQGGSAFLLTHGLRELFVRYGIVEEEPEVVEDRGWPKS